MSANCEWCLTMTGRNRNKYVGEILTALYAIENVDAETGEKIFRVTDGKNFWTKVAETTILTDNSRAKLMWGDNYLELTADVCIAVAKAAPLAAWDVSAKSISESGGMGCESYLNASYKDKVLEVKTDNYVDTVTLPDVIQNMDTEDDSYESFCECYNVDESIDEDTYEEFKYDDCADDFFYNHEKNTISKHHFWDIKTYAIE